MTFIHHKARSSPYPGSTIRRFDVPDDKVDWGVSKLVVTDVEETIKNIPQCPIENRMSIATILRSPKKKIRRAKQSNIDL